MCVHRDNKCSVWCQCGKCTHNYLRGSEDLREVCPKGPQRRTERKTLSWLEGRWSCWSIQIPQFLHGLVTCDEWWIYWQRPRDRVPQWKHSGSPIPKKARQSQIHPTNIWWSLFLTALAWSTFTGFPLDRQSTRNNM